jgi:hypothetical protein
MHTCIHRAELDPAYKTCSAGKEQSPIDFQFLDLKKSQLPQIGWYFLFFHFFIFMFVSALTSQEASAPVDRPGEILKKSQRPSPIST